MVTTLGMAGLYVWIRNNQNLYKVLIFEASSKLHERIFCTNFGDFGDDSLLQLDDFYGAFLLHGTSSTRLH